MSWIAKKLALCMPSRFLVHICAVWPEFYQSCSMQLGLSEIDGLLVAKDLRLFNSKKQWTK